MTANEIAEYIRVVKRTYTGTTEALMATLASWEIAYQLAVANEREQILFDQEDSEGV